MDGQEEEIKQEVHDAEPEQKKENQKKARSKPKKTADEKTLTEDELYTQIQTEKLLASQKRKRIATISALSLAFLLALCVIVLAVIPVSLKPKCVSFGFNEVFMCGTNRAFDKDDKNYDKFMKYYNKAFSQNCLSALFSGGLDIEIEEPYDLVSGDSYTTIKNRAGDGNRLIRLRFSSNTPQIVTKQNGSKYLSKWGSPNIWDKVLKFTDAYVVISPEKGVNETMIYIIASYPTVTDNQVSGETYRIVEIKTHANTNILYEAWDELTAR